MVKFLVLFISVIISFFLGMYLNSNTSRVGECYRATGLNPSHYKIVGETTFTWRLEGIDENGNYIFGLESKDFLPGPKYGRVDCR